MSTRIRDLLRKVRSPALNPGPVSRYGVAAITVPVALSVRLLLFPLFREHSPYLPFTLAVMVAALFGGRGPGIAATALSALGAAWFFLAPIHSFAVANPAARADLALFVLVGCLISLLAGHSRESHLSTARAADALGRQALLIDLSHDAIITTDPDRRIITWNAGAEEMYGWTEEEAVGKPIHQFLRTSGDISTTQIDEILRRERQWDGELSQIPRDGRRIIVDSRQVQLRDKENLPAGILEIDHDISKSKQAEEARRASEAQFRTLANGIQQLCWMANADGSIFWYNQRWYEYTGTTPEQVKGWGWQSVHDPEVLPKVLERWKASIAAGESFEMVFPLRGADGVFRPFLTRVMPVRDQDTKGARWFGTNTDISEQRNAEEALRESHDRELARATELQAIMDAMPVAAFISRDPECREMIGNRMTYELLRLPPGSNVSRSVHGDVKQATPRVMKDGREIPRHEMPIQKACATGQRIFNYEFELLLEDGSCRNLVGNAVPLLGGDGRPRGAVGIFLDITERKQAEQERERLLIQLQTVLDSITDGVVIADVQGNLVSMNPAALAIHGYQSVEQVHRHMFDFKNTFELFDAAGRSLPMEQSPMARALRAEAFSDFEARVVRKDTGKSWTGSYSGAAVRNKAGEIILGVIVLHDITERKQAEERLRQTQKLESIGLLAGGVAHDFNNLLTVIMGSASAALTECPSCEHSQAILSASERAAYLTKQLMAYAGKGQSVPKIFNLTDLVSQSTQLLSASVPKRVSLVFNLSKDLPPLEADPSQIVQILMNLVINAGESIPHKTDGRIEVATGNCEVTSEMARLHPQAQDVAAGPHVCLDVRDNGSGMDETTLSHIFDPFFSTKFTGRGLGLAAVHGIVRSSKGFIDVHSSPGGGSTFRVFLPASEKQCSTEVSTELAPSAPRQRLRRSSTILVVDDEEMLRKLACITLRRNGYEVLEAKDGKEALQVLADSASRPALVLLDLAMPVMGGDELVPILKERYPGLKVVVSSGYPEEDARSGFPPEAVVGFLQKPYTVFALAEKVGEALDSGPIPE
jgi:PAS domain S-box-containing protein